MKQPLAVAAAGVMLGLALYAADGENLRPRSAELDRYVLKSGPIQIAGVHNNASGAAWSPETRTLFVVINSPPEIVELTTAGKVLRTIALRGFSDTEGICHIKGNLFAVAEEGRRNAVIVRIDAKTGSVDHAACLKHKLDPQTGGNMGLEGIACDGQRMILYGVKEKHPRKVYAFAVRAGAEERPREPWDAEKKSLGMKDLSGIHFHAPTRRLLVLSDDSRCLVECTTSGVEVSRMSLARGSAGLKSSVPQPEGVTMDAEGTLYIVSEPNMLYVFEKRPAATDRPGGGR